MPKIDIYQQVTDQVIDMLEKGSIPPWRKPWSGNYMPATMAPPLRSTGEEYKGINILMLWIAAMTCNYESRYWMTYRQAAEQGGQVRKGQKSTPIIFYGSAKKDTDNGEEEYWFVKTYAVFNADQIDGLPDHFRLIAPPETTQTIDVAEEFIRHTSVYTRPSHRAYFTGENEIAIPPIASFESPELYYSVYLHELIHWTGTKSRMHRECFACYHNSKAARAEEELIAELGSAFLSAQLGLSPPLDTNVAYLQGWLKALKNDKRYLFKAAAAAQRACDYLWSLQPKSTTLAA